VVVLFLNAGTALEEQFKDSLKAQKRGSSSSTALNTPKVPKITTGIR
jgi:hypothetical protein